MRRGIAVLKSFVGAIKVTVGDIDIGVDIEPEPGAADSGDLGVDLPSLFAAMGEAAQERGVGVAILVDEIQYFSSPELSVLIMAMHKMQQRQLPLVLIAAGLPLFFAGVGVLGVESCRCFAHQLGGGTGHQRSGLQATG